MLQVVEHVTAQGQRSRRSALRKSYAAELRRLSSNTYNFRPADRTDDYSASDSVISEALQQTDFDGIRHGVLMVGLLFPPPRAGFGATSTSGSRADPRERGSPCAGGYGRRAEAGAVTISLCMP